MTEAMNYPALCDLSASELKNVFENFSYLDLTFEIFSSRHNDTCSEIQLDRMISWIVPVSFLILNTFTENLLSYSLYFGFMRFLNKYNLHKNTLIIFSMVCIVGFIGNLLVIIVVVFYQQMRNTTNILLLSLATADLMFIVTCIPPTAIDYAVGWPLNNVWCKVIQYLIYSITYGSVYTLVLLSLDRYLAVVYPVKSISLRTQLNTTVAIGLTWLFTLTTCIPIYFLYGTKEITPLGQNKNRTICTFDRTSYNEITFQAVVFTTMLVLPLLLILWLYMNMLTRLWRGTAATHGQGPLRDTRNKCKGKDNKMRVTRMIVVVVIVFVCCWTPLQVVLLLKTLGLYDIQYSGKLIFQIVTHCLAYCNSCLNPIVYAFLSPNFRLAFRALSAGGRNPPQFNSTRKSNLNKKTSNCWWNLRNRSLAVDESSMSRNVIEMQMRRSNKKERSDNISKTLEDHFYLKKHSKLSSKKSFYSLSDLPEAVTLNALNVKSFSQTIPMKT